MTDKMTVRQALRALDGLQGAIGCLPDGPYDRATDAIDTLRAHLTDPNYVRVPEALIETLRAMSKLHIEKGTVLIVHMNDIALHLDMLAAAQETSHE